MNASIEVDLVQHCEVTVAHGHDVAGATAQACDATVLEETQKSVGRMDWEQDREHETMVSSRNFRKLTHV